MKPRIFTCKFTLPYCYIAFKKMSIIVLNGNSGNHYAFTQYGINSIFPSVGGVYLITKGWDKYIYLGQTENLSNRFINHHKKECYDSHGADYIWFLKKEDEEERKFIEKDILERIQFPCNEVNN